MPTIYGTNSNDYSGSWNLVFSQSYVLYGWSNANLPGDEGPANDNDYLVAYNGNDTLYGGNGADWLDAGGGTNYVYGGAGNDLVWLTDNSVVYSVTYAFGGTGINELSIQIALASTVGETISLADPSVLQTLSTGSTFVEFQYVRFNGGNGNDTVTGGIYRDIINGEGGNNQLNGGDGDDDLSSSNGYDVLFGGNGNDTLSAGSGHDYLDGGDGNDAFFVGNQSFGSSGTVLGGAGNDTINVARVRTH